MKKPASIRSYAAAAIVALLIVGYLLWRDAALRSAADQLRDQMKSGAIKLIEAGYAGPHAQKTFILSTIDRTHVQAFERCPMERSFNPLRTRSNRNVAVVSVNVMRYLTELRVEIQAEAQRQGIALDEAALNEAWGLSR